MVLARGLVILLTASWPLQYFGKYWEFSHLLMCVHPLGVRATDVTIQQALMANATHRTNWAENLKSSSMKTGWHV